MDNKSYRYELKFVINKNHAEILKYRLSLILDVDSNSVNDDNTYYIRSLYFDDLYNSAYYEKIDGLEKREKYRIRIYNFDDTFIRLERKEKNRDLTHKEQCVLTKRQCNSFINRKFEKINLDFDSLIKDFTIKYKLNDIRPSVIVDYKRLAYTFPVSDIRITFDEDIKSGRFNDNLFDKDAVLYDILDPNEVVLEVKFNEFIPKHITDVLSTIPAVRLAVSKFALCVEKKEV